MAVGGWVWREVMRSDEIKAEVERHIRHKKCPFCMAGDFMIGFDVADVVGSGGNENCVVCKKCRASFELVVEGK